MNCPYDRLWIYELEGSLAPPEPDPGSGFLGCWVEGESAFLFFDRESGKAARALAGPLPIREEYRMSYLEWQGGQAVEPFRVGPLCFRPPWVERPRHWSREDEILLDPGLVFGSGNHPTTRHCLQGLADLAREGLLPERVLDLGCGTGVLSLAAARLGGRAVAVDLNPLCCQTTARNVGLNRLEGRIEVRRGDALDLAQSPAGLLLANIQAGVIEQLAQRGGFRGRDHLLLSGLTRSQVGKIRDLTREAGFSPVQGWEDQATWFTYLLRRE